MISLSPDERRKFAAYLNQEVATNEGLIEKLEELGPGHAMLAGRMKAETAAATIISLKLTDVEELTL